MATIWYKTFDDLMTQILTEYKNLDPQPDTSAGSPVFIRAACSAAMLRGLYAYQDYLSKQPFPDTCDTDSLNHWGSVLGVSRLTDENDSDYALRIITYLQQPPAGGNAQDYYDWTVNSGISVQANGPIDFLYSAVSVADNWITITEDWVDGDTVRFTTSGTLPSPLVAAIDYTVVRVSSTKIQISGVTLESQGTGTHTITSQTATTYYPVYANIVTPDKGSAAGTVDIVIKPNDIDIINPSSDYHTACTQLENAIYEYIETKRPVTAAGNNVYCATPLSTPIYITVYPASAPATTIKEDVEAYIDGLPPGKPLYLSQLISIAISAGAEDVDIITPEIDVAATEYQQIISTSVTVIASN